MLPHLIIYVLVLTLAVSISPAADVDLSTLHPAHPRLFLPGMDLERLKQTMQADERLNAIHQRLTREAETLLIEKPVGRVLIGPRLLDKSRTALRRISTLAGLYRLDGDARFADRDRKSVV